MTFCDDVWNKTERLQQAILDHPFNRALSDGSLDVDRFSFYLTQDSRYLVGFAKALATAATRADIPEESAFYAKSAQTALLAERTLHAGYLDGVDTAEIATAPSALAYVSFLHSVALTGDYAELVAAVLPCYWVYQNVGSRIAGAVGNVATHPYGKWIATYSDAEFAASVDTAKSIADRVAKDRPDKVGAMTELFVRASEYEWMFWEAAWRLERWPTEALR